MHNNHKQLLRFLWVYTLLLAGLCPAKGYAQYLGGNGSGEAYYVSVNQFIGLTDSLYNGGANDGLALDSVLNRFIGVTDSLYNGGIADGFTIVSALNQTMGIADSLYNGGVGQGCSIDTLLNGFIGISDSLYNGGVADGFTIDSALDQTMGIADSLYNGGAGQGFTTMLTIFRTLGITDSLYNGGAGRGDWLFLAPTVNLGSCSGDTVIWNGSVSIFWGNPANWDCGIVPGINSNVIVPSGRIRYPLVLLHTEIKSLRINPGASVNVGNGFSIKLNGQ